MNCGPSSNLPRSWPVERPSLCESPSDMPHFDPSSNPRAAPRRAPSDHDFLEHGKIERRGTYRASGRPIRLRLPVDRPDAAGA